MNEVKEVKTIKGSEEGKGEAEVSKEKTRERAEESSGSCSLFSPRTKQ